MTSAPADTEIRMPDRPFASTELATLGVTRAWLRRQLSCGAVRSPFHGVYVPAHLSDTTEIRARAVGLATTEHHVICDRTAAWIHGVDAFGYAELQAPPAIETCARRGHRSTRLRGTDGRTRDLADSDIMTIGGVSVTTPLRTALDLGCNLREREAMAALNAFARRHGITVPDLTGELPRFRHRRGVVQLRELVPLVDPRMESERESWVLLALHAHGIPAPEPQYWIDIDGVPTYRLDFAWVKARVCVEYNGVEWHDKTPEQRRADEERHAWLRDHGWTVIVVRIGDFTGEALDRWIRAVQEALKPAYSSRRF